jgi:hypothetical protein
MTLLNKLRDQVPLHLHPLLVSQGLLLASLQVRMQRTLHDEKLEKEVRDKYVVVTLPHVADTELITTAQCVLFTGRRLCAIWSTS